MPHRVIATRDPDQKRLHSDGAASDLAEFDNKGLPLIYHREHLFPYTSYSDTEAAPAVRDFRMVSLENEFLRVQVAPELGGRVYSLFDKRIGKEILFSNPVVKPVRILPIWAFISGGMEFTTCTALREVQRMSLSAFTSIDVLM